MQIFFDFFPIILFFVSYKLFGIYAATIVAVIASILQTSIYRFKHHHFEFVHIVTLITLALLGGATIFLHDIIFIKWKPTVLYWILALLFLATHFVGEKKLIQHMMESKLALPETIWNKLNLCWMVFFAAMGFVNLYVVYHFTTDAWVNFKLFGTLGLTIVFVFAQSLYMAKYVKDQK
jgi:intracellular septation protein